jgi:NAD(P)H-hydrate epimerase
MPAVPVLSPAQSEQWDALAEATGASRATLMESAGRAAAVVLGERYATELGRGVLVAAGRGNNGGDGWVVARALHRVGVPVWVATVPGALSPLADAAAARARREGVRDIPPDGPWPSVGVAIDALLGTGARGAPDAPIAALLERVAELRVPIVALDGPTGVDLATGVVHGSARADLTITFGGFRRGHLLARDEVGGVVVVDVGHPLPQGEWTRFVSDRWAAHRGPRLAAAAHKGDRGRIVVAGGAPGMSGALRLAARAALAAGAGYVHAAAPPATAEELRLAEPELLSLEQPFDAGPSGELIDLVGRADVLLIGPGLGRGEGRAELVEQLAGRSRRAVLDADALVAFQGEPDRLAALARSTMLVLTPHPGEFRALFPDLASARELDPWGAAAAASERCGATVLLKGVPTVIGRSGAAPLTVAAGNPGLGTGGSGDVLSGILATLLAQLDDPLLAAALAAHALGRAADAAARRVSARALRPLDVVAALPDIWRQWERLRQSPLAPRPPVLAELARPATA